MKNHLRVISLLFFSLLLTPVSLAFAQKSIPVSFFSNSNKSQMGLKKNNSQLTQWKHLVEKLIGTLNPDDYLNAKVKVLYTENNTPDSLLIILSSSKTYDVKVMKVKLDENNGMAQLKNNYVIQEDDYAQQTINAKFNKCPDNSIQFVSATPVDDIPTAKRVVENVYQKAVKKGYKAVKLMGNQATVGNYLNYLSCPKLIGFFNVGHGTPFEIILDDDFLSFQNFKQLLKDKFQKNTVVLFNSCQVHNDPLKQAVVYESQSQKYIGGVTNLYIGPSEATSDCFWDAAFNQQQLSGSLYECNRLYDPSDVFGIEGLGAEYLRTP